jgi:NAD(P)-dependent dehydrogenase (short-subunit alcohol dehydrogenase family)
VRLKDKVAIVTGGAQGIGGAIARRFAAEGAKVVVADIAVDRGEQAAAAIRKSGAQAIFVPCNVADSAQTEALVAETLKAYEGIDICVCAAGLGPMMDFFKMTRADFERLLAINLTGPFILGQAVARHMVEHARRGCIVNVSSVSAELANPGQVAYCASKAGLGGLTRAMAIELAPHGIRVNAIAPGPTYTAQSAAAFDDPKYGPLILSRTPIGHFAQPDEIAGAAVFLASEDASFVTGETLFVDGGRSALNYVMPPKQ